MSTKEKADSGNRIVAPQPPPAEKEPAQMPPSTTDPMDNAALLWGLRLWFVCALLIVACAVANYLLNWFAK